MTGRVIAYTNPADDVPSPIDLRDPADARAWAEAAEGARPGRAEIRAAIAAHVEGLPSGARVLELGSGPGFLAEVVLTRCPALTTYTLFDFSEPMLEMSRQRLAAFDRAEYVCGDFKEPSWTVALHAPYDAVLTMQAVHELRHKRHAPALYRQLRSILRRGGPLLVADHVPQDASLRWTSLHMTAAEQRDALTQAGFTQVEQVLQIERLLLMRARS